MEIRNPLAMDALPDGGPYVLPPLPCSQRRQQYLQRADHILSMYTTIIAYACQGEKALAVAIDSRQITDCTPIRLAVGHLSVQTTYGVLRAPFGKAGTSLASQVFLMVYGNFEAYLADLGQDALTETGNAEPYEDALKLLASANWEAKLTRVSQKFDLGLTLHRSVCRDRHGIPGASGD